MMDAFLFDVKYF